MSLQTQFYHENVPVLLEGDELFAGGARVGTYKSKIYDFIGNTSDEDAKSWDYQWEIFKELHTKALEHYPNFNEKNFTSQFKIDLSTVQGAGKKILDAGAGTGRNARMLASHDFEVYALDGSKSAYYQSVSSEDKRIIWVRSPLAQLPMRTGFFDGILCDGVIPHVSKIDNVLHEFHRALAPNGVLFLSYSSPPKELFSAHNMVKIYRIFTTRMKYENILRLAKFLSSFYVLVKALKVPNILKRIPLLLVPDQSSYDQWRECYIFD
ncbi:MAG: hypothetical protein A2X49_14205, partial [Lentisphaerae bacterium GWF2_52_8]